MTRVLARGLACLALGCSLITDLDGVAPQNGVPGNCDPGKTPSEDPCVVIDALGIFVDADGGKDLNPGTHDAPVKTFTKAAALADASRKRIYACAAKGSYDRATIGGKVAGVFGKLSCADWSATNQFTQVAPSDANGPALTFASLMQPIIVDGLAVVAPAGTPTYPSSVAVFVSQSPGITFRDVAFQASPGSMGPPTPARTDNYVDGSAAADGNPETKPGVPGDSPGAGIVCTCKDGSKSVGGGGLGALCGAPVYAQDGAPAQSSATPPKDGKGGQCITDTSMGCGGDQGADAPPTSSGVGAAAPTVDASGLVAHGGTSGSIGGPGQGGGGGGAATGANGTGYRAGGGGACGGCGGAGGAGGATGGSSIALLVFQTPVTLDDKSTLLQDVAADGQPGVDGQAGQAGGMRAAGGLCWAGNGGHGGAGGSGGSGAGGISAAIAYKGLAPTSSASTPTAAKPVAKGASGPIPGANGISGVTLALP